MRTALRWLVPFGMLLVMPFTVTAADLWQALAEGGKVVLIRHAPVERGPGKGNSLVRDPSCKRERNLSREGRHDAETLRARLEARDVPIGKAQHSPFCRATDTAHILFDHASPADDLSLLEILPPDAAMAQSEALSRVIASHTGPDNLFLVTHEPNIRAVSFELMKHLDMLVLEPDGQGDYEELGVIRFADNP